MLHKVKIGYVGFLVNIVVSSIAIAADWQAAENIKYYEISGITGAALYKSIGQKGPTINMGTRTIAVTNWDLKWRRNYQPKDNGCELVDALPFVRITYTLPKPAQNLSGTIKQKWDRFAAGIKEHEKVHGDYIKALARNIINSTVGLRVEDDRACKKIRNEVLARVKGEFDRYKADNSAFERDEMRKGGNVQKLIIDLVR